MLKTITRIAGALVPALMNLVPVPVTGYWHLDSNWHRHWQLITGNDTGTNL